jgi:tRNA threonylcarbamoyladenosine biosynthesis protein TsaE
MRPSEAVSGGVIETRSEEETRAVGVRLARGLGPGAAVGLVGPLGSGKTVLAKGIAEGLGCAEEATSPSFTLVNVYEGAVPVYHIDFYRLADRDDVESLGFRDYLDGRGVVLVEWPDRVPGSLPADRLEVTLRRIDDERRSLSFHAYGEAALRTLEHL